MALALSLFFGFVPMFLFAAFVYWLDRYEKEPKALLGATFFWGVIIATGGAFIINTTFGIGIYVLSGSEAAADFGTTSIVAPIVEEVLKGLAVAIVFFLYRKEFDSILDGIIYGGIVGLGFAASENTLYIYRDGYLESGWGGLFTLFIIRVMIVGWMHAYFTAFTGIGFAIARINKNTFIKLLAPFIGLGFAIGTHSFHNTFGGLIGGFEGFAAGTFVDWFSWTIMFGFILWMINAERTIVKNQLWEEVTNGLISQKQYQKALSFWNMTTAAMVSGKNSAHFYQICGELAHKKEQLKKLGDEDGNTAIIQSLRLEMTNLAPHVK